MIARVPVACALALLCACPVPRASTELALLRQNDGRLVSSFSGPGASVRDALTAGDDYVELTLDALALGPGDAFGTQLRPGDVVFVGLELVGLLEDTTPVKAVFAMPVRPTMSTLDLPLRLAAWPYPGRILDATFTFRVAPAHEARPFEEMLRMGQQGGRLVVDPARPESLQTARTHFDAVMGRLSSRLPVARYAFALHSATALAGASKDARERVLAAGSYVLVLIPRGTPEAQKRYGEDLEVLGERLRLAEKRLFGPSGPWRDTPYLVLRVARHRRSPRPTEVDRLLGESEAASVDGDHATGRAKAVEARGRLPAAARAWTGAERRFWADRVRAALALADSVRLQKENGDGAETLAALVRELRHYARVRVDHEVFLREAERPAISRLVSGALSAMATLRQKTAELGVGPAREALLELRRRSSPSLALPPAPPALAGTKPRGPSAEPKPKVQGSAEAGAVVRLYPEPTCTGAPIGQATVGKSGSFEIEIAPAANATTRIYADARDPGGAAASLCSEAVVYVHDDQPPSAPTLTLPPSPSRNATPAVTVAAEAGSRVELFLSERCEGGASAELKVGAEGRASLALRTPENASTPLSAIAIDAAGNRSPCASSARYVHDSIPPSPPILERTEPASPSRALRPKLVGRAEAGARVRIHDGAGCGAKTVAEAFASPEGRFSLELEVAENGSLALSASAEDRAGNRSACSAELRYVNDRAPPPRPELTGRILEDEDGTRRAFVTAKTEAEALLKVYARPTCRGKLVSPEEVRADAAGGASVEWSVKHKRLWISARAEDRAGNQSPCVRLKLVAAAKPKVEPPKVEPPKVEPPKVEPPKVEPPKVEPPKVEPPKVEPPKVEPPKVEPPKVEPPVAEPPKVEPPVAEPPKVEPPSAEPPAMPQEKTAPPRP